MQTSNMKITSVHSKLVLVLKLFSFLSIFETYQSNLNSLISFWSQIIHFDETRTDHTEIPCTCIWSECSQKDHKQFYIEKIVQPKRKYTKKLIAITTTISNKLWGINARLVVDVLVAQTTINHTVTYHLLDLFIVKGLTLWFPLIFFVFTFSNSLEIHQFRFHFVGVTNNKKIDKNSLARDRKKEVI